MQRHPGWPRQSLRSRGSRRGTRCDPSPLGSCLRDERSPARSSREGPRTLPELGLAPPSLGRSAGVSVWPQTVMRDWKEDMAWSQKIWVQVPALPITSCMMLGQLSRLLFEEVFPEALRCSGSYL
ncbi:uncharacterized protein LOC114673139 isoform X2 [Macaca mulatta]